MQDELINSYLKVLVENKDEHEVKTTLKTGSDAFGDLKEGNDADENVDLESPKEEKRLSSPNYKDSQPKALKKENKNPFDALYSKLVKENSFNFSTNPDNELEMDDETSDDDMEFDPSSDDMDSDIDSDLESDDMDLESDIETPDDDMGLDDDLESDEEVDLQSLVSTLQDVLSQLEKIVDSSDDEEEVEDESEEESEDETEDESEEDGEESEEESEEVEDESEEDGEEKPYKESYSPKKKKKCCVKKKKIAQEAVKIKGLKSGVNLKPFKGNVKKLQNKKAEVSDSKLKASKSKAQAPATGKGYDGVPTKLSPTAGHNLTKASSHTVSGAVKPGKGLFEQ